MNVYILPKPARIQTNHREFLLRAVKCTNHSVRKGNQSLNSTLQMGKDFRIQFLFISPQEHDTVCVIVSFP